MTLNASQLYFAHFGASGRAQETLQMAIDQIQVYAGMVAAAVSENGLDGVAERLSKELRPALEPLKKQPAVYKLVSEDLLPSGINGFINYYSKKHKN
jgi:vacuolar-type H+-ATPase subunit E/Vma4